MLEIKEIMLIKGALARSDGFIKLPESQASMPHGGVRKYKTRWVKGVKRRASKGALHEYYGTIHKGKNYKIHRLICEAFHGKPPFKKAVVIHINEDALDNRAENLKWGTQKENLNSERFIEYCKSRTGENSPTAKARRRKYFEQFNN
jgi:hypothetical protein